MLKWARDSGNSGDSGRIPKIPLLLMFNAINMFDQYKNDVLSAYRKMKAEGKISLNLIDPTPGKLRDECLIVYHERYSPKDDEVLRLFFNWKDQDYLKGIEHYKIDGFKQLAKVLNGREINLGNRFVELLAWLIDFQPRPYRIKDAYAISETYANRPIGLTATPEEKAGTMETEATTNKPEEKKESTTVFNDQKKTLKKIKTQLAILMGALMIMAGIFINYLKNKNQCMYWTGDHYQPIPCTEQANRANVIPYDEFKVKHLQRITKPDTLTLYAVKKVWYYKVKKDSVDFYTQPGELPTNSNRRLLPVTEHIINKYVLKTGKD